MTEKATRRSDELRGRHRRAVGVGLLVSLSLHLCFFAVFRGVRVPPSPFAAAGPRSGDDRAAAGGGMQALNVRVAEPLPAIIRPPVPVPVAEEPVEIEEPDEPEEPEAPSDDVGEVDDALGAEQGDDAGQADGVGEGAGGETGEGEGDGGTEAEGRYRVVPPRPRGLILPPSDRPGKVRGREIAVWVFVDATGKVVPDSTRVIPSSGDSGFDKRLARQAADWVFEPARKMGEAVAEWFTYRISL